MLSFTAVTHSHQLVENYTYIRQFGFLRSANQYSTRSSSNKFYVSTTIKFMIWRRLAVNKSFADLHGS